MLKKLTASSLLNDTNHVNSSMVSEEESDSDDSVFSSSSSISSANICLDSMAALDMRDVYLGGSCVLRTKWRHEYAIPYLVSKGATFHLPALHESLQQSQTNSEKTLAQNSSSREKSPTKSSLNLTESVKVATINIAEPNSILSSVRPNLFNPTLLDSSRVLLFVITNETRSLAPMTLAAYCIGLMYNVVLAVQMLPENCIINNEKVSS